MKFLKEDYFDDINYKTSNSINPRYKIGDLLIQRYIDDNYDIHYITKLDYNKYNRSIYTFNTYSHINGLEKITKDNKANLDYPNINYFENNIIKAKLSENKKDKMNMKFLNESVDEMGKMQGIRIPGWRNTWSAFEDYKIEDKNYYIMENDIYGDETNYLVITPDFKEIYETYDDIVTCLRDENILTKSLEEDTVKQNGKWVNKGKEGTHGTFKTKKAAGAQRKAMYASGYKESFNLDEALGLKESVDWNYFNKFRSIIHKYMPEQGEGEIMASQIVTALNKLIYRWYNDGDVYDNTHYLRGWANDLSSYANWLYKYVPKVQDLLDNGAEAETESQYEETLQLLADYLFDEKVLEKYNEPKEGTIYSTNGPFKFEDREEDDEDNEYDYSDDDPGDENGEDLD